MALTPQATEKLNQGVSHAFAEIAVESPGRVHQRMLEEVERGLLRLTLRIHAGNQSRTAAFLGINRNTLRKRLKRCGLVETRG